MYSNYIRYVHNVIYLCTCSVAPITLHKHLCNHTSFDVTNWMGQRVSLNRLIEE